jgi:hypothetical protein
MNVGSATFLEPFFHGSVGSLRGSSDELETDLAVLRSASTRLAPVLPAGVIFNMSRCGSTLLLNLLKRADNVVGLSEAQPFERMMYLAASRSVYWAKTCGALLTPLTTIFAHYQGPPPKRVVLKCAMGGIATLKAVRAFWPDVPCVVLIRNPTEVLVSNVQKPPRWLREAYDDNRTDGLFGGMFGPPPDDILASGIVDLSAWAVGRYCAEALAVLDDGCRVVDYEDLTEGTAIGIAEYFGLSFSAQELHHVRELLRLDAKTPWRAFDADSQKKRSEVNEIIRTAATRFVEDHYSELRRRSYRGWSNGD